MPGTLPLAGTEDPQMAARDRWHTARTPGRPVRVSRPPFTVTDVVLPTGQVTGLGERIIPVRGRLGYSDRHIGELHSKGAVWPLPCRADVWEAMS